MELEEECRNDIESQTFVSMEDLRSRSIYVNSSKIDPDKQTTDLRFILTVFKQKYLKIRDTHEVKCIFRTFWYEERPLKKEKVSSIILPEIMVKKKNAGINKITL